MLLRTLIVWAFGLPATVLAVLALSMIYLADKTGNGAHFIISLWSRMILAFSGVRVSVTGQENLPKGVPLIILSNHCGAFDIPVLQACLPVQFRWMAKKSLFRVPLIGWAMSFARYIPVDREQGTKAYRSLKKAAEKIKAGTSVLIFPEGTRNPGNGLLPFKRGAFLLAGMCKGAVIVPVALAGTTGIMKKGGFFIRPASVSVAIGKPVNIDGVTVDELSDKTKEAILKILPS